jgi:hypothetical protein
LEELRKSPFWHEMPTGFTPPPDITQFLLAKEQGNVVK